VVPKFELGKPAPAVSGEVRLGPTDADRPLRRLLVGSGSFSCGRNCGVLSGSGTYVGVATYHFAIRPAIEKRLDRPTAVSNFPYSWRYELNARTSKYVSRYFIV
jgi:hypothetical protein